ncbi:MAG: multicopper oxidase domain-containing protein, partial [Stackebrandtia sp.]
MQTHPRPVKRRRVLKYGLSGLGLAVIGGTGAAAWAYTSVSVDTVGKVDFTNKLRIPELNDGQIDADGKRVFDLQLKKGASKFKSGAATKTWGVNGSYLGPTLRASRGDTIAVNVRNSLGETSSLHWHGMHLPAKMDGGPHQSVAAYDTWSPTWTVDQPAATLWYH